MNIHRFPAGGRNFESYGEDPWLASRLAVSYIKALQSQGVIASVEHFALNNQEWQRTEVNVIAGSETIKLYVSDTHNPLPRPVKELKGFAKVVLNPGQEKKVTMHFNSRSFAYYDVKDKQWKVDPGNFEISVGSSSADIRLRTNLAVK
ncbi:MAG: fibronectin type III-like domain-contianing protein [Bacteroidales bacterium]|nr:fibronectin type III-like domain-contianing protein [Bacteroidales bacterium]